MIVLIYLLQYKIVNMNIAFENLAKIDLLIEKLNKIESKIDGDKRWLSTKELSNYIPYSIESINKKVQNGDLVCGIHFYQKQKIRMFDKSKIDEWITTNGLNISTEKLKQSIIQKIKSDF